MVTGLKVLLITLLTLAILAVGFRAGMLYQKSDHSDYGYDYDNYEEDELPELPRTLSHSETGCYIDGKRVLNQQLCDDAPIRLQRKSCWFETEEDWPVTECYDMYVPENHLQPQGRSISFPVLVFRAEYYTQQAPVLHLGGGGPGSPVYMSANDINQNIWLYYWDMSLGWGADLYIIDPRGLGKPLLNCPDYYETFLDVAAEIRTPQEDYERTYKIYSECYSQLLAEGVDFSQYNSTAVAKDVDLLRYTLGLEQWNLFGISYASRYAQTVARDFPERVNAMVLDSVVFPDIRYTETGMSDARDAFNHAFEFCENESWCRRDFPDLEKRFWQVVEDLEANPLSLAVTHPDNYTRTNVMLNGQRFLSSVFSDLYDSNFLYDLPGMIASLEHRNADMVAPTVRNWLLFQLDEEYADLSASAHYCFEEYPFVNHEHVFKDQEEHAPNDWYKDMARLGSEYEKKYCDLFNFPTPPQQEGKMQKTDVPALLLHGELDPVLPVKDVRKRIKYFPNGEYLIFSSLAHGVVDMDACAEEAAGDFFYGNFNRSYYESCL